MLNQDMTTVWLTYFSLCRFGVFCFFPSVVAAFSYVFCGRDWKREMWVNTPVWNKEQSENKRTPTLQTTSLYHRNS